MIDCGCTYCTYTYIVHNIYSDECILSSQSVLLSIVMQMYVEYLCSCSFPLFVCNHIYYIIPLFIEDTSGRAPTLSLMESGTTILQFPCVEMSVASQGST